MQRIAFPFLLALAVPFAASASDAAPAATQQVYTWAVELGADGRIASLAPHGAAPGKAADALAGEIRGWVFNPGDEAMRTYLRVVVDEAVDGCYEVVSATTGPALAALTTPAYPVRDQLAGNEGTVVLRLQIGTDGRVQSSAVHTATGSVSRGMAQAAEAASREWRFAPEQVAGQPVASTLLWPVCYLGAQSAPTACRWTGPDAQRFSSKSVLPLDPRVIVTWTAAR